MQSLTSSIDYSLFKHRRKHMHALLAQHHVDHRGGLVMLFGDFENEKHVFRQESSFYYFTGVNEPGAVLFSYTDGQEVLYLPKYGSSREQWLSSTLKPSEEAASKIKVDVVKYLGEECRGYVFSPLFSEKEYQQLLGDLGAFLATGGQVFSFIDYSSSRHLSQCRCYDYLLAFFPSLKKNIYDVSELIGEMRRTKDSYEIDTIYKAVQVTSMAHEVAAGSVYPGVYENEVQAHIEHVFTSMGAFPSFPSIVATGKNSTILHYVDRNHKLKSGDLVVVDIGAEYRYYAADITRTYPVSGAFTDRQREIYNLVLTTQEYIELQAKPGMFINNPAEPEKSLHHLALKRFEQAGYMQYFIHGIGHFLGLDVHDTGNMKLPLRPGDVFTIEPGLYIPEENLGVRIEDDYVIVDDGCVCLSANLPRSAKDIEALIQRVKSES